MRRLAAGFLVLVTVVVLLVRADDPTDRAAFVFVNRNEHFTLDPQRMSWMHDFRLGMGLYEGLVRWDNDDFTIRPGVAAAWSVADDGITWRFRLDPDARWSNGDPVTAADFRYTWNRLLLPDTAADYSELLFMIEGGASFFEWRLDRLAAHAARPATERTPEAALALYDETIARFRATVGVRVLDRQALEVRLVRPVPYLLDLLAFAVFSPVHRPTVEGWPTTSFPDGWTDADAPPFDARAWVSLDAQTGRVRQIHQWTKPGRLVGNGPYVLDEWRYRRGMRLVRNPYYRDAASVRSTTIACIAIEDANTAVMAFESGEADWLTDVSTTYQADMVAQMRAYHEHHADAIASGLADGRTLDDVLASLPAPGPGERRDLHVIPTFGTDFWSFNCRPTLPDGRANPFADAHVRRAFVLATDRATIVHQVTRLDEPVATCLTPRGSIPGYDVPDGLGYDPVRAQRELAAGGWFDDDGDGRPENAAGEPFPVVDLLYNTNSSRHADIAIVLGGMWQRTLGVEVALRGKDSQYFKEDLKSGNFMVGRGSWYGDYGDPTTFLDIFRADNGNNDRGYSNPRIDAMLDDAADERDPATRLAKLAAVERVLFTDEVPMLTICQLVQLYMYDPTAVRGISRHPRLVQYLWELEHRAPEPTGPGPKPTDDHTQMN